MILPSFLFNFEAKENEPSSLSIIFTEQTDPLLSTAENSDFLVIPLSILKSI